MKKKQQLIVIQGPTASGKTALAIALAKKWKTVILSADSRQFYREMSIGTAKPNLEEQDGIKHYFIDSHSVEKPISAADFQKEALEILEKEFQVHDKIILVGGSGMYISALCMGLDNIPHNKKLRDELTLEVKNKGLENLLEELKHADFTYFQEVDKHNPARIIRAIEAIRLSGKKYSDLRKNEKQSTFFESIHFVIDLPREFLYERINQRVDKMFEEGLVEEVKSLYTFKNLQSLNTVAYSELFDYLDDKISFERAVELIKQNTRRYAKRQLTWFRRNKQAFWLKGKETYELLEEVLKELNNLHPN